MDRILFGDNQFFGINHMSDEHARAQSMQFQSNEAIMAMLDGVLEEGIEVLMCTTHERVAAICESIRAQPARYRQLKIYPCMPYAHKYANAVSDLGIVEAVRKFLPDESPLTAAVKSGIAVARRDVDALIRRLIDAEMKMFVAIPTPVIFLQNVVTDLALGLGFHDALRTFHDHVRERYGAEPGFITMNLPRLLEALDAMGIDNPIVCANVNKIGFRMCGGLPAYEETVASRKFRAVAMSVFASGAIPAEEAIEYVCGQPRIESIVFGASSLGKVRHTKYLIDRYTALGRGESCSVRVQ
ncbi:hypothetical protein [Massilia arenae]|uniref:Uncharacterized protein n=1 Tax=Massilia arenae TaxID=2603288 RepID=A0A5C7FUS5_9BURK|nr:hypothetical protein [Massilia arenae]TXF98476.1 hypothetical protein FVD38_16200 [Massilia arenae]